MNASRDLVAWSVKPEIGAEEFVEAWNATVEALRAFERAQP